MAKASEEKPTNGWSEYSKLVLHELTELDKEAKAIRSELTKIRGDMADQQSKMREDMAVQHSKVQVEIARLQVKAGVWGLLAGAVPAATALIIILIKAWV